jgi:glycosyltransferase involved in cell wall biosynthesis
MNIIYCSQFSDSCGYAVAARGYLHALDITTKNRSDINIKIHDVSVESVSKLKQEEKDLLSKYSFKHNKELEDFLKQDYVCLWHYPSSFIFLAEAYRDRSDKWKYLELIVKNSKKNINYTTWEADKIPSNWLDVYRKYKTSAIITPCKWNQDVFSNQVAIPVHVLPHALEKKYIVESQPIKELEPVLQDKFVVFSMSQWQKRKGFDKLIQAFCMEFKDQKDVLLLIKTYGVLMGDYNNNKLAQKQAITKEILEYKNSVFLDGGKNPNTSIVAITDVLPYENIAWLYKKSNLFALLTRGEGFGLTIAESIMNEIPVMVTDKTGHMDFVDSVNSFLVDSHLHPYVEKVEYHCDMNWAEPDLLSARKNLRSAYNLWKEDKTKLKEIGSRAYNHLLTLDYTPENIGSNLLKILEK